jgi:T5SS/PEP-CTERM-associated repeat protein
MRTGSGTYSFDLTIDAPIEASIRWNNSAGGSFDTPGNWQPQVVPSNSGGARYTAVFDLDAAYGVALPTAVVTERLVVRNSRVDFNVGQDWTLVSSAEELPSIIIGDRGRLNITAGSVRGNHGSIGADFALDPDTSPIAEVLVANSSGSLHANGRLTIGDVGKGRLFIANGAVTSLEGRIGVEAPGEVIVGGRAANWVAGSLAVGHGSDARLTIENGGLVESATSAINATGTPYADADTEVIVQGVNTNGDPRASLWRISDELTIDNATLRVRDGGRVLAAQGISMVGDLNRIVIEGINASSGKRSELVSQSGVVVGGEDLFFSFIDISDGADMRVTSGTLQLGWEGREGKATVSGIHSSGERSSLSGDIIVGSFGRGLLEVLDGAIVSSGDATVGLSSPGDVQISTGDSAIASKWALTGNLQIGLPANSQGTVTLSDAALDVGGTVTIGELGKLLGTGLVNGVVSNQGGEVAPGLSPGTLIIDGDFEQTAGRLSLEVAGTAPGEFDVLKVTGNATIAGHVRLEFLDGFAPRQGDAFELLDVAGTMNGQFANIEVRNLAPEFQFDLQPEGGGLRMVALNNGVFVPPPPSVWNIDADGTWSSAANWSVDVPDHAGAVAVFGNKITAPRSVTAELPVTVGRIDFDSARAYTVAGPATVTLNTRSFAEQINVLNGSHTISAPVTFADNTSINVAAAPSKLTITSPVNAGGVTLTKIGAGTLTLNNLRAAGLLIDEGKVAIAPNAGTAEPHASVFVSLSIAGGAAPTSTLDLTDNAAIIDYAGSSPAATVREQILAGRGGSGLGASWTGQGITSSAAAAANATDAESRSIGYAENSALPLGPETTFRGQSVDDTSVLIVFTRTGDANLDGVVNDDDVTIVSATYAPGVPQASWALGDFDYNGFVDDDDVTLLGAFYNSSAAPLLALVPVATRVASVPEPSSLAASIGIFGVLTIAAAAKRRSSFTRRQSTTLRRAGDRTTGAPAALPMLGATR